MPEIIGGLLAGVAGGTLSGLFGVGGGFVMIPLLSAMLGLDQHRAQGAALAIMMMPVGLPGVLQYRKQGGQWNFQLVALIVGGFLCGVTLGSLVANMIPQLELSIGFATFLACMAAYAWFRGEYPAPESGLPRAGMAIAPGLAIGAVGGITSGLTGLGGAAVIIPLLIYWFRMTQHQAQMTSLLVLFPPIGLPGVLIYAKAQGGLPWLIVAGAVLGFDLGSYIGARVANRLPGAKLKRYYSLVLLLMAGMIAWKAVRG